MIHDMQFLGTFVSLFDRSTGRWKWYAKWAPNNSEQLLSDPPKKPWLSIEPIEFGSH